MSSLFSVGFTLQARRAVQQAHLALDDLFPVPKVQQSGRYIVILHNRLHSFPLFAHVDGA
jgi:hypothetical protein